MHLSASLDQDMQNSQGESVPKVENFLLHSVESFTIFRKVSVKTLLLYVMVLCFYARNKNLVAPTFRPKHSDCCSWKCRAFSDVLEKNL